jgi:hypothetical protein
MTHSGDAAEQIVRMSLDGVEVAVRITGAAAKELATFLAAALKSKNSALKTKGKARLAAMLKSGKALEIFSVKDSDLSKFYQGAKQYGIVYAVLRNKKGDKDGMCDIMVKADDAPKISRVIERFKFATVDKAQIESEIMRSKADKAQEAEAGRPAPDKDDTEKLLDDIMGTPEGKAAPEKQPEAARPDVARAAPAKESPQSPEAAETAKPRPSEPTSESRSKSAGVTSNEKPSVKEELREIRAAQKSKQEADAPKAEKPAPGKSKTDTSTTHRQPPRGGKTKSKKPKVR